MSPGQTNFPKFIYNKLPANTTPNSIISPVLSHFFFLSYTHFLLMFFLSRKSFSREFHYLRFSLLLSRVYSSLGHFVRFSLPFSETHSVGNFFLTSFYRDGERETTTTVEKGGSITHDKTF